MQKMALDLTDLKIIKLLSINGRMSYRSIGLSIGMTSKSVKARVDKMISGSVIEKFVIRVNPGCFGYQAVCMFIVRHNISSKGNIITSLNLLGDVLFHVQILGGTSIFGVAVKEGFEDKISLVADSLSPAQILDTFFSKNRYISDLDYGRPVKRKASKSKTDKAMDKEYGNARVRQQQQQEKPLSLLLTASDVKIIRCLSSNPRMEISDIAKQITASGKTIARRLDRLIRNNILEFSIICNPSSATNYIQFGLVIYIDNISLYESVNNHMYREFKNNILYHLPLSNASNALAFVLYSEDIFTMDNILNTIESFDGVKRAAIYVLAKITNYDNWLKREINRRSLVTQPNLVNAYYAE